MEDVLGAGSCHSGDRHPTNDRPASCRPRSVPGGPLGARARQFHSLAGVNPLQTTWLERGTVISRVALLPRTDEVQPWFGRFVPDRTSVSGRGFRSRSGSGTGRLPEETRPRFPPKCATKRPGGTGRLRFQHGGASGTGRFQRSGADERRPGGTGRLRPTQQSGAVVQGASGTGRFQHGGAGERAACETPCTTAPHTKGFVSLHVGKQGTWQAGPGQWSAWTPAVLWGRAKGRHHSTRGSRVIPRRSTNLAQLCLTSEIGRDRVHSEWFDRGMSDVECRAAVSRARLTTCYGGSCTPGGLEAPSTQGWRTQQRTGSWDARPRAFGVLGAWCMSPGLGCRVSGSRSSAFRPQGAGVVEDQRDADSSSAAHQVPLQCGQVTQAAWHPEARLLPHTAQGQGSVHGMTSLDAPHSPGPAQPV